MGDGAREPRTPVDVREEPLAALREHAGVSSSFRVERVLNVAAPGGGAAGGVLSESPLDVPYVKDYDALDGGPARWAERFDVSRWGLLGARLEGRRVGGAVIARDTAGLDMLRGRRDVAVLWDIRVSPECRGRGVGSALFRAAEAWAIAKGCRWLEVETQNINVAACRFYERQGCLLEAVNHDAYPELPGEVQLIWRKELIPRPAPGAGTGAT